MKARLLAIIALFVVPIAHAGPGNGNSQPGDNVWEQLEALQAQVDALQANSPPGEVSVNVDCNAGDSINTALQTPASRLDITYSGTCYEAVDVERANVTLTGNPGASIEGSVEVDGEGPVELLSVSINNSQANGLVVHSESSVEAINLHVSNSAESGIVLINASFECADCSSSNNGSEGLIVTLGSRVVLAGTLTFNNNTFEAIELADSSTLRTALMPQSVGAAGTTNELDIIGNGGFGILTFGASAVFTGDNTTLTVDQNGNGIGIATGSTGHFFGVIETTNNGVGLSSIGGSIFLGGAVTSNNNTLGVFVSEHAQIRGNGSILTTDNGFGVFVRAGYFGIAATTANNNVTSQVFLQTGSIVRAQGASVTGDVFCDGTEVIDASFVCGAN